MKVSPNASAPPPPVLPGAAIGILGGGQLGRMSAMAAKQMGYRVVVFDPDPFGPAAQVADEAVCAPFADREAVARFASSVDVVTFEFENVPAEALEWAGAERPARPGPDVLRVVQHRLREKTALQRLGIPVAPFMEVRGPDDLKRAAAALGTPFLVKTCTGGYDGKGQWVLDAQALRDQAEQVLAPLAQGVELVAEGFIPFEREISVIAGRSAAGETAACPPVENIHRRNILHVTTAPAALAPELAQEAQELAVRIAEGLDVVGLLAVEMFLVDGGRLVVNELAPRPHNSGHWSLDAAATSQFEQHIRAICGLPLGGCRPLCHAAMRNVLGESLPALMNAYAKILSRPNVKVHLYGKAEARPGRKMGHITVLADSPGEAAELMDWVENCLDETG